MYLRDEISILFTHVGLYIGEVKLFKSLGCLNPALSVQICLDKYQSLCRILFKCKQIL